MSAPRRFALPALRAAAIAAALAAVGCDTGGLLVVGKTDEPEPILGPPALDFVSGGTVATSSNFRIIYTVGQPSPGSNVSTSTENRLNGGLIGAVNGK